MLLVVAALFATGLASMSSVPIAAQLADAKEELDHWTDEQAEVVSRHHGQIATQNAGLVAAVGQACSCISPAATE